jgi:death-on-curing family protein
MATHAPRLARLFTPTYARLINAQIVHPAASAVVKPNELCSALARPLQVAHYEPHQPAAYLAASLSYGIIKGHPFFDGNKRTAFFLANEYVRAMGIPGLADGGVVGEAYADIEETVRKHVDVAKGELDIQRFSEM